MNHPVRRVSSRFLLVVLAVFIAFPAFADWEDRILIQDNEYYTCLEVFNFDNDGDQDIICGTRSVYRPELTGGLDIFENLGHHGWHKRTLLEDIWIREMELEDFDHDGRPELLIAAEDNGPNNGLAIVDYQGPQFQFSWTQLSTNGNGIHAIALGDVNNDGFTDIAAVGQEDSVYVYVNPAGGTWPAPQALEIPLEAYYLSRLAFADMDADDAVELYLVRGDWEAYKLARYVQTAPDEWTFDYISNDLNALILTAADPDNDGEPELYAGGVHTDVERWELVDGLYWQGFGQFSAEWESDLFRFADVDMDGMKNDVIVGEYGHFKIHSFDGVDYDSTIVSHYEPQNSMMDGRAVDWDGDGDTDVLTAYVTNPWGEDYPGFIRLWEQTSDDDPDEIHITLETSNDILILHRGDELIVQVTVESGLDEPVSGWVWSTATTPNGQIRGPLQAEQIVLTPGFPQQLQFDQVIPATIGNGTYSYSVHVGHSIGNPQFSSSITPRVVGD